MSDAKPKLINLLFIEDVPIHAINLINYLGTNPVEHKKVQIISALCIEHAYNLLKTHKYDGIIADLEIPHCEKQELSKINEIRLKLTDYAPPKFAGIGILLMLQNMFSWIPEVPKLILSDVFFEMYADYYARLRGPGVKDNSRKGDDYDEDEDANSKIIRNWIKNNF